MGESADLTEGESEVGGGSFPGAKLKTWLVRLTPPRQTADSLAQRLREGDPPVVARIEADRVVLDARTILPSQHDSVIRAVRRAVDG